MNYYEQFYDDLEFADPEDDPYHGGGPPGDYHHGNRPKRRGDWHGDDNHGHPYSRGHEEWDPSYRGQREFMDRDEEFWSNGQSRPDIRGQRGRGGRRSRGRGRGAGGDRGSWGRGGEDRSRGRGRGPSRGFVNFVKATVSSNEQQEMSEPGKAPTGQVDSDGTIRFDYKAYQSQPTEAQKEVSVAMGTYVAPVLPGYGYGEGSGFENFGAGPCQSSAEVEPVVQTTAVPVAATTQSVATTQQEQQQKPPVSTVKKAIVSPMMNFVKAKSEFKSTDVAFHEEQSGMHKMEPPQKAGVGKRAGFGAVISSGQVTKQGSVHTSFQAGKKGDRNPAFDRKFQGLKEAIVSKSLPTKNGIEILHMAVDKVKMKICDEIKCSGRTPTGQPMFECRLEIDGVYISQAASTAKKRAKHDAYTSAVSMFLGSNEMTVLENNCGSLMLVPKSVNVPMATEGNAANFQTTTNSGSVGVSAANSFQSPSQSSQSQAASAMFPKPKIVFHQPSHPLTNQPLVFKQPAPPANPQEMAMKLLNFVKEGEAMSKENEKAKQEPVPQKAPVWPANPGRNMSRPYNQPGPSMAQGMKRNMPMGGYNKMAAAKKAKTQSQELNDLSQFIIVDDNLLNPGLVQTDLTLLHKSANWNRVVLKLEYESNDPAGMFCRLVIGDHVLSEVNCSTKDEGKLAASEQAMKQLKEICYTIVVKQQVDTDQDAVTKDELINDLVNKGGNEAISNDNVGNKLLRKMGWIGGGCGKDGKGIAEPIKASIVIGREGLGLSAEKGVGGDFNKKVRNMLQDYIKDQAQHDLHFSSELSKEERAVIHKMGQSLGLKTQSKGKNENRFLIVSRKRSANELLRHVLSSGGETNKYRIIPPSDPDSASCNPLRPENLYHGNQ